MYRVLVPVDDNEERALAQARFVTDLPGADEIEATVAHALQGRERSEDVPEEARRASQVRAVRAALEYLRENGVRAEAADIDTPPAAGIVEHADRIDADLIVMGGRKRSAAGKAVFGSVTQSVILTADRAVAVAGTGI